MKRLVSPDTVLILPSRAFGRRVSRTPWPDNGHAFYSVDAQETGSLNWVCFLEASLKSGDLFFYPFSQPVDLLTASAIVAAEYTYFPWPNRGYGVGEYWNYVCRQMVYAKIANADWPAWLAAR